VVVIVFLPVAGMSMISVSEELRPSFSALRDQKVGVDNPTISDTQVESAGGEVSGSWSHPRQKLLAPNKFFLAFDYFRFPLFNKSFVPSELNEP